MANYIRTYLSLTLIMVLTSSIFCDAQNIAKKAEVDSEKVFTIVEEMPQFPGGDTGMFAFIKDNIRYPLEARTNNIQGKVYVSFIVDTNGAVINSKIVRGIGGGCDEEAMRVISMMPQWIPGKQNGKHVKVAYTTPIYFKINVMQMDTAGDEVPFTVVEVMPEFQGGPNVMMEFIKQNLRYPYDSHVEGKVYIKFVIDKNGKVRDPFILKGLSKSCNDEAIRVITMMPDWIPARQNGKAVPVYFNLPIMFSTR